MEVATTSSAFCCLDLAPVSRGIYGREHSLRLDAKVVAVSKRYSAQCLSERKLRVIRQNTRERVRNGLSCCPTDWRSRLGKTRRHDGQRQGRNVCVACAAIVSEPPEPKKVEPFANVVLGILLRALPAAALAVAAFAALQVFSGSWTPSSFSSLSLTHSVQGPGLWSRTASLLQAHCAPIFKSAYTGLAAGCLHTLTGPDHLAALAPLTIGRSRVASALLGALWGGGHGTGQLLLGAVFVLFKDQLTNAVPILSRWSSTLVGLTLMAIGAHGLKEAWVLHRESAEGSSAVPGEDVAIDTSGRFGVNVATYCNGVVFGLQPDALLVVLPALALPSRAASATYVLTFLIGTVAAMGTYTAFIGAATRSLGQKQLLRLSFVSGILALILGGVFVFNISLFGL